MKHHDHKPGDIHGHFDVNIRIGGFHVAQATGSFSINVKGLVVTNPLVLFPTSGQLPDETEGTTVDITPFAHVSGGTPPYNYQITGLPSGVTATETANADGSADVSLTGTPDTGDATNSPYTVSVTVTDSAAAASAKATRNLNVIK